MKNNCCLLIKDNVLIQANAETLEIPNFVTKIGEQAFRNCTDLKAITIPDSVTTIGACAF
jgi:hypothetical protein